MRYFKFDVDQPELHIYPIVCWHLGAKQSSSAFIARVIETIKKDKYARWVYMGDGGECVTKISKGNIYEQTLNPGDQLRAVAALLEPIREKGLFGIRGNHGNRIDKETGLGWDEMLCALIGIPYLGVSALGNLSVRSSGDKKMSFSLYTHHGSSGSVKPAGKMSAAHRPEEFIDADICLTAHTHACGEAWPARFLAHTNYRSGRIEWKKANTFVCGSAYDSRSGYAEEKMYAPIVPEHLIITIKPKSIWNSQEKRNEWHLVVTHEKIREEGVSFVEDHEVEKWRGR